MVEGADASSAATCTVANGPPQQLVLKLRTRKRRVRWESDVVDNEDLCRKKSKCCCIYHPPRGDEPSEDEDDMTLPPEMQQRPGASRDGEADEPCFLPST